MTGVGLEMADRCSVKNCLQEMSGKQLTYVEYMLKIVLVNYDFDILPV